MPNWVTNDSNILVHNGENIHEIDDFIWSWLTDDSDKRQQKRADEQTSIIRLDSRRPHQLRFECSSAWQPLVPLYLAIRKRFPDAQLDWRYHDYAKRDAGYLHDRDAHRWEERVKESVREHRYDQNEA